MSETPTPSLLQDWLREKARVPYFAAYRGDLLSIAHALDSLHRALTAERAARKRAEAELKENEAVINVWRGRTQRAEAEREALLARSAEVNAKVLDAAAEVLRISDRKHEAWDQLRAALAALERGDGKEADRG